MHGTKAAARIGSALLALAMAGALAACTGGGSERPAAAEPAAEQPSTGRPSPEEPGAFRPAGFEDLLGEWKALPPANQNAFIHFTEYGLHFGSDGCNSRSGAWGFDDQGVFSADGGGGTQVGCDNVEISYLVAQAERVEISGNTLRLTSPESEIFELLRTEKQPASIVGNWAGPGSSDAVALLEFSSTGRWIGRVDHHEYRGTWSIVTTGWRVVEDDQGRPRTHHGPTFLRIGPAPVESQSEYATPMSEAFPLAYDTEYSFGMSENAFYLRSTPEVFVEPPAQPLTFHRLTGDSLRWGN